jgi:small subunit ribosomal protein S4
LKGGRCYTKKCAIDRRNFPPGQSAGGPQSKSKPKEYAIQLREKQKTKRYYRVLEKPFRNTLHEAERRRGVSGENLLALLELRLDNVVYRLNLSSSRAQARQLVSHGHISVNGHKVDIASYIVRIGDAVSVLEASRKITPVVDSLKGTGRRIPDWLSFDLASFTGKVLATPTRDQIDAPVEEQLIVEFYSR